MAQITSMIELVNGGNQRKRHEWEMANWERERLEIGPYEL